MIEHSLAECRERQSVDEGRSVHSAAPFDFFVAPNLFVMQLIVCTDD